MLQCTCRTPLRISHGPLQTLTSPGRLLEVSHSVFAETEAAYLLALVRFVLDEMAQGFMVFMPVWGGSDTFLEIASHSAFAETEAGYLLALVRLLTHPMTLTFMVFMPVCGRWESFSG